MNEAWTILRVTTQCLSEDEESIRNMFSLFLKITITYIQINTKHFLHIADQIGMLNYLDCLSLFNSEL